MGLPARRETTDLEPVEPDELEEILATCAQWRAGQPGPRAIVALNVDETLARLERMALEVKQGREEGRCSGCGQFVASFCGWCGGED